ncbi:hypothetical protein D5272_18060 [bacterium D16-76]|nr:hypothetical protein [bacterium D16-76]
MALEYWNFYAVSGKTTGRKCKTVLVWDTKLKKVVDSHTEYFVPKEEYNAWCGQIPPLVVERVV